MRVDMQKRKIITCSLDEVRFFVHPHALADFNLQNDTSTSGHSDDCVPLTIVSVGENQALDIAAAVSDLKSVNDDVLCAPFLHTIVVQQVGRNADDTVTNSTAATVVHRHIERESSLLPNGPYFLLNNRLHQAWRLYDDYLDAFVITCVSEDVEKPER